MHRSTLLLIFVATSLAKTALPGVPRLDGRIVGGNPVTIQQYPYQVSIGYNGYHMCGGSIISPTTVLSAAKCTFPVPLGSLTVRADATYLNHGGKVVKVESISHHPEFNPITLDYDVSVLHLAEHITVEEPITLFQQDKEIYAGTEAVVTGWGSLVEDGQYAKQLQAVNVSIAWDEVCKKAYKTLGMQITARMICAGVLDGGKGTCWGDRGGPLIVDNEQVGIASWSYGCAQDGYPAVYTKISSVRDWISTVSGEEPA